MHKFTRIQKNLNQFKLSKTLYLKHIAAIRKPDLIFYFINAVQFQSLFLHPSHWCNPAIRSFFFFLKLFILLSWTISRCHRNREAKFYNRLKVPFPGHLSLCVSIPQSVSNTQQNTYFWLLSFASSWFKLSIFTRVNKITSATLNFTHTGSHRATSTLLFHTGLQAKDFRFLW